MQELQGELRDSNEIPAVAVFSSNSTLRETLIASVAKEIAALTAILGVGSEVSPGIPAAVGKAVRAFVTIQTDADIGAAVTAIGTSLRPSWPYSSS